MATAPEFQPPVCCVSPTGWGWHGSWEAPTRQVLPIGNINHGAVERKLNIEIFCARSIN